MDEIIVKTDIIYTWKIFEETLKKLKEKYPFISIFPIGKSVMGKNIYVIKIGCGQKKILFNGAHHANEWITSVILLKFAQRCMSSYINDITIFEKRTDKMFEDVTLYIVPLVNPDGMDLVNGGIKRESVFYKNAEKISKNYTDIPFPSGWKANIEGIDLNLNYPAGWGRAKKIKFSQGFSSPSPKNYVGAYPLCAPESRAMYNYTVSSSLSLTLSYHTQGKVIYWKYLDYLPKSSEETAKELSKRSGYTLEITPAESSFAGYKDWFISRFNKPGYTIEAGKGENPLDICQFDEIYADNEPMLIFALETVL